MTDSAKTKNNPEFTTEFQIPDAYVDSLGHVNNASYLSIFEEARWRAIQSNGYGFKEIELYQKGPVILEANLKFLKELKRGESISVHSEMLNFEGKVGRMKQTIFRQTGEAACEAHFVVGFFDLQLRKLIPATPEWLKACGY